MYRRVTVKLSSSVPGSGISFTLAEAQREIQHIARKFAIEFIAPRAAQYDGTMKYPHEIFNEAWKLGLVNVHIPPEFGGIGLHVLDEVIISEEVSWGCSGVAAALTLNNIACTPLILAGTKAQKKKFLGRLTEQPLQAAYAVTEAEAGSDLAALKTTAERKGDQWVLNGQKMWITNCGVANWFFVLAKSKDGFVGLIVEGDSPGVVRGKKEVMLGQRCSDTRGVTFENVIVPKENLVGRPGEGFKLAMKTFDRSRPVVAINAVGLARRAMEEARNYALERKTMGLPIAQHQSISFMLAEMAAGIEAGRLLAYRAAWEVDQRRRNSYYASIAKMFTADHVQKVVADALQIFGGNGYSSEYPVEKLYRDAKVFQIYEGTGEVQRLIISRTICEK